MELVGPGFAQLFVGIPVFLVWIAGIVLALVTWRRHTRVSLLVVIALVIFILESLVGGFVNTWLPLNFRSQFGTNVSQIGWVLTAWSCVRSILSAIAWGLILAAIFAWRQDPQGTESAAA